jgi:hypothetical protein
MTRPHCSIDRTKWRCVGSLDDEPVYFIGSRVGFHLVIERAPGVLRRLTDGEHARFKQQSRVEGIDYGEY